MPLASTPNATDLISQTQSTILGNFDQLITWIPINHVDTGLANLGWHKIISFPAAMATANPAVAANTEIAILPFTGNDSLVCEVATQKFGGNPIAFTEGSLTNPGWSRFGSGLLIKYGTITTTAGVGNITFSGPAFSQVFTAQATVANASAATGYIASHGTLNTTSLVVYSSLLGAPTALSVDWLVIGVG